jgi:hypothetical protein
MLSCKPRHSDICLESMRGEILFEPLKNMAVHEPFFTATASEVLTTQKRPPRPHTTDDLKI